MVNLPEIAFAVLFVAAVGAIVLASPLGRSRAAVVVREVVTISLWAELSSLVLFLAMLAVWFWLHGFAR